jgi:hypothetical protein
MRIKKCNERQRMRACKNTITVLKSDCKQHSTSELRAQPYISKLLLPLLGLPLPLLLPPELPLPRPPPPPLPPPPWLLAASPLYPWKPGLPPTL